MADVRVDRDEGRPSGVQIRGVVSWFALVLGLWFVGGAVGLAVGVALGAASILWRPLPRWLLALSIGVLAAVPVLILVHGLPSAFFVSPAFVSQNLPAHYVAGIGLALLVFGVVRSVMTDPPSLEEVEAPPDDEVWPLRETSPLPRTRRLPLFAIVLGIAALASVALRLAISHEAVSDPITRAIAANLLDGKGFGIARATGGLLPTASRMPLAPGLLALAGVTDAPAAAARFMWAIIGAATVPLTGIAAARLLGRPAGAIAAALVALLPVFWLQNVALTSTTLAAFLVSLLLFVMASPSSGRPSRGRALAVGAVAGGLSLARPEGLIVAAFMVAAWLLVQPGGASAAGRQRRAGLTLAAILGVVAVLGPWLLRSQSQIGRAHV